MSAARHPFAVRKQSSGRTASVTWFVVRNPGGLRVSTWPHATRETAQASADALNVGALVKDYHIDPRPYTVRLAEAQREFDGMK